MAHLHWNSSRQCFCVDAVSCFSKPSRDCFFCCHSGLNVLLCPGRAHPAHTQRINSVFSYWQLNPQMLTHILIVSIRLNSRVLLIWLLWYDDVFIARTKALCMHVGVVQQTISNLRNSKNIPCPAHIGLHREQSSLGKTSWHESHICFHARRPQPNSSHAWNAQRALNREDLFNKLK